MKKLSLNPEALVIHSFATDEFTLPNGPYPVDQGFAYSGSIAYALGEPTGPGCDRPGYDVP